MEESKKVLIIDENQDGVIDSNEIIGVTSDSKNYQPKDNVKEQADKYINKQLKIKVKKERVIDKSFEL